MHLSRVEEASRCDLRMSCDYHLSYSKLSRFGDSSFFLPPLFFFCAVNVNVNEQTRPLL